MVCKKTMLLMNENKWREIACDPNNSGNQNKIFRIAREMVKERQDVTGSNCLKDASGRMVVD